MPHDSSLASLRKCKCHPAKLMVQGATKRALLVLTGGRKCPECLQEAPGCQFQTGLSSSSQGLALGTAVTTSQSAQSIFTDKIKSNEVWVPARLTGESLHKLHKPLTTVLYS